VVRAGLPRSFTDPWAAWLATVLPASRERLGDDWLAAWSAAPIWRFSLPAGVCGPKPALGLWIASFDRAGEPFPLTCACVGAADFACGVGGFLPAAEQAGLAAVRADLPPAEIKARLAAAVQGCAATPPAPVRAAVWWTDGAQRRPALGLTLPGLPQPATFAAMLDEGAK
jgi:type VI secretion system protein ImpM